MKNLLLFPGILLIAACASTATMDNSADSYIRAASQRFASAFNAGDFDTLATFYTDDAVVMPPNEEIARGPVAIRKSFAGLGTMKARLTVRTERVVQSGDMAYEYGTYDMTLTPPGQSQMADRGKFVTVWRKMPDGEWRIAADIFNTSLPAPGM